MKIVSGIWGLVILLLAVVFALSNRQPATLVFWPLDFGLSAPLCFFLLASLLGGALLGAAFVGCSILPTYWETRRLRRELARQRQRIAELQEERKETANTNRRRDDSSQLSQGLQRRSASQGIFKSYFCSWGPR